MTRFENGPAAGRTLMLKRAPVFLRVVIEGRNLDALDQLEDTPRPGEKLFAYVLKERPGMCHLNAGRGKSGFYPVATYVQVCEQPTDEVMRDKEKWAIWCESPANRKFGEVLRR